MRKTPVATAPGSDKMAKLSQKAVKELADQWAAKKAEIAKLQAKRNAAIEPIIAQHNEELAPMLRRFDPKIEQLESEADSISGQVLGWLNEQGAPIRLEGENAVAEYALQTKVGARVIDVKKFLETAKSTGEAMFDCINILVAKAEKLLGKNELDQISERPESESVSVTLKLK